MKDNDYYNSKGIETIELLEELIERDLPPKVAYHSAQAMKYLCRLGKKTKEYESDLFKAFNYLHRALYGVWVDRELFEKISQKYTQKSQKTAKNGNKKGK